MTPDHARIQIAMIYGVLWCYLSSTAMGVGSQMLPLKPVHTEMHMLIPRKILAGCHSELCSWSRLSAIWLCSATACLAHDT